jgi:hypothetical protein
MVLQSVSVDVAADDFYRRNLRWRKELDQQIMMQKQALANEKRQREHEECTFAPKVLNMPL